MYSKTYIDRIALCHVDDCGFGSAIGSWIQASVTKWQPELHARPNNNQTLSIIPAAGRPTMPSWLAMFTMLPLFPGRPS